MVMPRSFLGLLLLLLALGKENSMRNQETSRDVCKGTTSLDQFDSFNLDSTGTCFRKCELENNSCALESLQRYWLDYEIYLVENSSMNIVNMSFVKTLVQNFSIDTSEDLHFSLTPSQIPRQVMANEHKPPDRVRLPRSFFESLRDKRSAVRLAITTLDIGPGILFKGPRLRLEDGSSILNNHLVGLSVGGVPVTGLREPLEITFSHQYYLPNMTLSCVFWDTTKGDWASKGCSTEHTAESTVCHCDHLTFFALLLRPTLDKATVKTLTLISQAGCGASMLFLILTLVFYTVLRFTRQRFKSEDAPKIHVALSLSLFLLNLVFLITVGRGAQVSEAACWARGAIFHYFLLCVFTWMGLESFHLYLLVIKVFNTYYGHYYLKLSLVGWGLPALMVIATGSADSYGPYAIKDEENRTTLELCWFRETKATTLYVTVHGYFFITFFLSLVILGLVAWKIFTLQSATAGKEQGPNWKGVLTVLGLSSLVGMTWGLAILTPLDLSTVYLFTLFNSLQGVFIFCWFATLYFPSQTSPSSSSGTARADQTHFASHG